MSDDVTTDTLVAGENVQPVNTDTEAETQVEAKSEDVSTKAPNVEMRDGKVYIDGVRYYGREETNRIASNAKKEAESKFLSELDVDSIDKVKSVVSQLRDAPEGESLNVQSLKDAVKKREQTVEELRAELNAVKTDYALRNHISSLKDAMPTAWNADQKSAVVDLMKARNMLHLEGEQFAIRNGEDYFTTDGETPDYASAVKVVGQSLGLPFAKKGVDMIDVDKQPSSSSNTAKSVDMAKVNSDAVYRAAYVSLRSQNATMPRSQITDKMVLDHMKQTGRA
jgi:hypothetical protein